MRSLLLKPLTPALLSAALELDRLSLGNLWSADGYLREIESPNSDLLIFQDGKNLSAFPSIAALGCSWAILEEAHVTIVAVHPAYQRQGLGQAMVLALLTKAYRRGLERATLEVRVSNTAAIALYEKFGFREAGRRKRYYQDTGEDALVMWRGGLHYPDFSRQLDQWQREVHDRLQQSGWQIETGENNAGL
ncbi:MAG: ribosomal protein S18-alanine N-acetyltransferase [Leptolyngbyaceae cyanobacterium bins.302]|nr:ribosomal protein S18-alanine N-acetyltransferase [Leptolyngbyaceae cyanobacterium bins.302]